MKQILFTGAMLITALYACAQTGTVADFRKISETKGNLNTPLVTQGMFGFLSETLSENILISAAPYEGNGAFYKIALDTDGEAGSTQKFTADSFEYFENITGAEFGTSVLELDDISNDGRPDYFVGAPGIQPAGGLFLVLSNEDKFSLTPLTLPAELAEAKNTGAFLAQENNKIYITSQEGAGVIYICSLSPAHDLIYEGEVGSDHPLLASKLDSGDRFGSGLSFADMNGDGITDIICGAPGDDDQGTDYGAVYILFRDASANIDSVQKISAIEGNFNGFLNTGDDFGISVRCIGDLDQNGVPDLVVGAPGDDDGGIDIGAVWILFMRPDGTVKNHRKINRLHGKFSGDLMFDDRFGTRIAVIGDHNNDGTIDIAVSSVRADDGGMNKGAFYTLMIDRCDSPSGFFDWEDINGTISFSAEGGEGYTHVWNFNDGGYSQQQNPTHTYESSGTYSVCLLINNSCGGNNFCQNVTVNVTSTVELEERLTEETLIYPNPSADFIRIKTEGNIESIRLMDITGKESMRKGFVKPDHKIDISYLPVGIYFAEMVIDGFKVVKRVQKASD